MSEEPQIHYVWVAPKFDGPSSIYVVIFLMRRSRGRPRDSKGRFIQSTKSLSELFGPTKTPPPNTNNRYTNIIGDKESSTTKVAS